jgi:hypothetical protein
MIAALLLLLSPLATPSTDGRLVASMPTVARDHHAVPGAELGGAAQDPLQELESQLDRAVERYTTSGVTPETLGAFSAVIDRIRRQPPGGPDETRRRALIARALNYRAQTYFSLDRTAEAERDLRDLLTANPAFEIDENAVPARFVPIFRNLKRSMIGVLALRVTPADAVVTVNGLPVTLAQGSISLSVVAGQVEVLLRKPGYDTTRESIAVAPGATQAVNVSMRPGDRGPLPAWRRVFFGYSLGYHAYSEPLTDQITGLFVYNRPTSVSVDYTVQRDFGYYEFGGGVRLFGPLAIGVTYGKLDVPVEGILVASVPHPSPAGQPRSMTGVITDLTREERAIHLEVRATKGSDRYEVAVFGGPSRFDVRQKLASSYRFFDQVSSVTFSEAITELQDKQSKTGFHFGVDASLLFAKYVGFGGFVRYSRGTVDFTPADGEPLSVVVGGVQAGGGLRVRF